MRVQGLGSLPFFELIFSLELNGVGAGGTIQIRPLIAISILQALFEARYMRLPQQPNEGDTTNLVLI